MGVLTGKVAVITGASRGLGLAIARAYVREGAAVVVASRSAAAVAATVAELQAAGARVAGQACDVGDAAQVQALADLAIATFGGFDIWVNNAGISAPYGPTALIPVERFDAVIQTNIAGTYHGATVALRHFLPKGRGKLINILGKGESGTAPLQSAYGSSKAWIKAFTRTLAEEYAASGVGIYALQPGMMVTDLITRPEAMAGYEAKLAVLPTVLRILGNPPEVPAERAVWLASGATDGKTGIQLRTLTKGRMLKGALREGLARLLGRKLEAVTLDVHTVKPE
jgi:NAD(P)-dependent dehydrogenase (short-subunit alcohol dehydrogenase family)